MNLLAVDVARTVGTGPLLVAGAIAVVAGAVSFVSPCVLPLVPGYLSYVTGLAGAELDPDSGRGRGRVLIGTALFVLGFTAVFVSYGALFGGVGRQLVVHQRGLDIGLGLLTIVFGLAFMGVLTKLPWLSREVRFHHRPRAGLAGAPLLGVLFAIGWAPCLGPTLGVVNGLALESGTAGRGAILSLAYCVGLGVPFLITGLAFRRALGAFAAVKRHYRAVLLVGGGMLVVLGVLEVGGQWHSLLIYLQSHVATFQAPV